MHINVQKQSAVTVKSRDLRKLRKAPLSFKEALKQVDWHKMYSMKSTDEMATFWTENMNKCLDRLAPIKPKKNNKKRIVLPQEVKDLRKKRNLVRMERNQKIKQGLLDQKFEREYKKLNNHVNRRTKIAVRIATGQYITARSTVTQVWKALNEILRSELLAKNKLRMTVNGELVEDPKTLAEEFNAFFIKKIQDLVENITRKKNFDPVEKLRERMSEPDKRDLKFTLETVTHDEVADIVKQLKNKTSHGFDGISSEIIKLGGAAIIEPLTRIVNCSIKTGVFPDMWKEAKVVPLWKGKGQKNDFQFYRPVSLLPVAGMITEHVVTKQIVTYFEENKLLGSFQFGFRRSKSTISLYLKKRN